MRITRLPQSCLLLEKAGHKIIIDPGFTFLQSHTLAELQGIEAVLYTHEHADHFEPQITRALQSAGATVYANAATAALMSAASQCTVVNNGDRFSVAGFNITALELPHCLLPNGQPGPQNTGYVIDNMLFHPGDGKALVDTTLQVDTMALPINGPDISMLDAFTFAKQVGVRVAIPIHYQVMPADPAVFADFAERSGQPFTLLVLADGQSTEV